MSAPYARPGMPAWLLAAAIWSCAMGVFGAVLGWLARGYGVVAAVLGGLAVVAWLLWEFARS